MLLPDVDAGIGILRGAGIGCQLNLFAIVADIEPFEVDEHLSSFGKAGKESAAVDTQCDSGGSILECHLAIEIAFDVVARNDALQLDILLDEDRAVDGTGILVEQFLHRDDILLCNLVVAGGNHVGSRLVISVVHAGRERAGGHNGHE